MPDSDVVRANTWHHQRSVQLGLRHAGAAIQKGHFEGTRYCKGSRPNKHFGRTNIISTVEYYGSGEQLSTDKELFMITDASADSSEGSGEQYTLMSNSRNC